VRVAERSQVSPQTRPSNTSGLGSVLQPHVKEVE
jgi:hypothetical protein